MKRTTQTCAFASLQRTRAVVEDLAGVLDRALEPARRLLRIHDDYQNELRLVVGHHALNALNELLAVYTLSDTRFAGTIMPHVRSLFEILVKVRWMRKDPERAHKYLESEPFERYCLATDQIKATSLFSRIVDECEAAICKNPELLKLPRVRRGKNEPPNYEKVACGLRMPKLEEMARECGVNVEVQLLGHGVPSLSPHTSVIFTQRFDSVNANGTIYASAMIDSTMLLGYVAISATTAGQIIEEVLDLFSNRETSCEADDVQTKLAEVITELQTFLTRKQS